MPMLYDEGQTESKQSIPSDRVSSSSTTAATAAAAQPTPPARHSDGAGGGMKTDAAVPIDPSTSLPPSSSSSSSSSSVVASRSSHALFYAAFFLPLTLYKSLQYRLETRPIFLRRTLHYGLAEANDARRRRRRKQRQILQQMKKQATTPGATTTTSNSAAPPGTNAINSTISHSRTTTRSYVHPDDLLGIRLALAAENAATPVASSSTTSVAVVAPSSSPSPPVSLARLAFSSARVSKRLQLTLSEMRFHATTTGTTQTSDQANLEPVPASTSTTEAAAAAPVPPSTPAALCQRLHVSAHLCHGSRTAAVLSHHVDRQSLADSAGGEPTTSSSFFTDASLTFNSVNFLQHDVPSRTRRYMNPAARAAAAAAAAQPDSNDAHDDTWTLRIQLTPATPTKPIGHETDASSPFASVPHEPTNTSGGVAKQQQVRVPLAEESNNPPLVDAAAACSFSITHVLTRDTATGRTRHLSNDEAVRVDIVAHVTPASSSSSGTAAAATSSAAAAAASSTPHIVGSCLLRMHWLYKQHLSHARSHAPYHSSLLRARLFPALPSAPVLIAWRYLYQPAHLAPKPFDTATDHSDPDAAFMQLEYRPNFSCTLCGLLSGIHLHSFEHLVRHLDASHSAYLAFRFRTPTTLPDGAIKHVASSASPSLFGADHSPPSPYEILVTARPESTSLMPLVVAHAASKVSPISSTSAGVPPPPVPSDTIQSGPDWIASLSDVTGTMRGLPRPFIEGVKMQREQQQKHQRTRTGGTATPNTAAADATSTTTSRPTPDPDLPHNYFVYLGAKYGRVRMEARPTVGSSARPSSSSAAELKEEAPSVKQLLQVSHSFAKARAAKEDSAKRAAAAAASSASGAAAAATSTLPAAPPASTSSRASRTRPAHRLHASSLTSALYSRQWYHASSGTPLSLGELSYDSDASVDEEWYIASNGKLIDEFDDVSASEKALMKMWNEFMIRKAASATREIVYADYLFPRVCAAFATTCAPLLRGHLRAAFLCHLLTCWEFGLLEYGHIESVMRLLDAAADEWPLHAATDYLSFHAPARSREHQSARDACGGISESRDNGGGASRAHNRSPQRRPRSSAANPDDSATAPTALNLTGARKSANNGPPRSARLRERELLASKSNAALNRRHRRRRNDDDDPMDTDRSHTSDHSDTGSEEEEDEEGEDEEEEEEEEEEAEEDDDSGEEKPRDHSGDESDSKSVPPHSDAEDSLAPPPSVGGASDRLVADSPIATTRPPMTPSGFASAAAAARKRKRSLSNAPSPSSSFSPALSVVPESPRYPSRHSKGGIGGIGGSGAAAAHTTSGRDDASEGRAAAAANATHPRRLFPRTLAASCSRADTPQKQKQATTTTKRSKRSE